MTIGVGGRTIESVLASLCDLRGDAPPIGDEERRARIARAQQVMRERSIDALYLDASTSLYYFTGVRFWASERLHGAVLSAEGELAYIAPGFEEEKSRTMIRIGEDIRTWEEHEDPTALVIDTVRSMGYRNGTIAVDESTPFFIFDGLRRAGNSFEFVNGAQVSAECRMCKSDNEIALMRTAKNITLEAHKAAASILEEGITTNEVQGFLRAAHAKLGAEGPPPFCIVLFGEPTAYPHGVPYPQTLRKGDMVLIDVGAPVDGYHSDITRSYVFGEPTARQREVWGVEKAAQAAAFESAKVGVACGEVDAAARQVIEAAGFGPGYRVPGLPHRTGHGIGLDVHEWTYLVKDNPQPLKPGMCFSNEPMICIYGEFGVRLEDHFYMDETQACWFTQPSHSIDDPFGYEAT